jgi:molybdopterin-containing oxidoreductase family iron-sulfur binding subunit
MNSPVPAPNKTVFRSLGQLEGSPEFDAFLEREFPAAASEYPEGISRRRWVQLMGASIGLASAGGCRYYREEFAGFVVPPEGRVAGVPQYFASNFEWAGNVVNVLAKCVEGRPILLSGNAQHPLYAASAGSEFSDGKDAKFAIAGTDTFTQAAVLSLYDPDRCGAIVQRVDRSGKDPMSTVSNATSRPDWSAFDRYAETAKTALATNGGEGLAIVYEPTRSPTFNQLLADVASKLPKATLVRYDSLYKRNKVKGLQAVGVSDASVFYRLDNAKVVVSIDSDLFGTEEDATIYSRQFAKNRNPNDGNMNRLYCVESQYSVTGAAADFRYALQSSQMINFLRRLETMIDAGQSFEAVADESVFNKLSAKDKLERVLQVLSTDLLANKGASALVAGYQQDPAAHEICYRINAKLENVGKTVLLLANDDPLKQVATIKLDEFVAKAARGSYKTAWVFAPNPVYTVAGDIDLGAALKSIETVVYTADYDDETAAVSSWVLPHAHPLEMWSDVRSVDGTYGVCQPMIAPITGARSSLEILAILSGSESVDPQAIVKSNAQKVVGGAFNEQLWQQLLHDGYLKDSQWKPTSASVNTNPGALAITGAGEGSLAEVLVSDPDNIDVQNLEVVILPSESLYDGRLANNAWLQECPQPITKLTWDNAALMSISTARALSVRHGEKVVISQAGASAKVPVFVVPGMAEGTVIVALGYGRTRAGTVGGANGKFTVGHSLKDLRTWNQAFILKGVEVKGTTEDYQLATTQDHFAIADQLGMKEIPNRAQTLVREGTLDYFEKHRDFAHIEQHHVIDSLWKEPKVDAPYAWAMAIDLNKCTGCNACVIACQAENNIAVVGKEQVIRGREMHWLRIDRYFVADLDATAKKGDFTNPVDPRIVTQPMACAHCETAPCEQVCPVAATVHTEEGINAMAYNRCVGTRYCANNCPYKVRRFNYFNFNQKYGYFYGWQDKREEVNTKLQSLVLNPDVTVRGRGVMEKCTYCIQRIQNAKIAGRNEGKNHLEDGDVITACQEACATQAIVFGDKNDKSSRVYAKHNDPRNYAVLEELNIKPRTLYLARLRNVPARLATKDQLDPPWVQKDHGHSSHDAKHDDAHAKADEHAEAAH